MHEVKRYDDGQRIGVANLTDEQFRHYQSMAQQPEGLIRLGVLPHNYYDLDEEYQDTSADIVVFLD